MTNTLKAEIDQRRQMLLETERNWQSGKITSVEFIELAREFTDSIISLFREYAKGKELTDKDINKIVKDSWGIGDGDQLNPQFKMVIIDCFKFTISKVMEGLE